MFNGFQIQMSYLASKNDILNFFSPWHHHTRFCFKKEPLVLIIFFHFFFASVFFAKCDVIYDLTCHDQSHDRRCKKPYFPGLLCGLYTFLCTPGGQTQCALRLIDISSIGVRAFSLEYTTFRLSTLRFFNSRRMTFASGQTDVSVNICHFKQFRMDLVSGSHCGDNRYSCFFLPP